jgi:hypothetical protein
MRRSIESGSLKMAAAATGVGIIAVSGVLFGPELFTPSPSCSELVVSKIGNTAIFADANIDSYGNDTKLSVTYSSGNGVIKNVAVNSSGPSKIEGVFFSYPDRPHKYNVAASVKEFDGQESKVFDPMADCKYKITIT